MPDKRLLNALKAPANTAIQKGTPYQVGQVQLPAPELPPQASALSSRLQELARQYLGARRRSGEALLDAARWLSEARAEAQHGEWHLFLEATGTSDDAAERLLNIHTQAMANPQFADAIGRNWLSQSAAALLARQSTPPEIVSEVLESEHPPTKADIERRIRATKPNPAPVRDLNPAPQNPHSADFDQETSYTFEDFPGQMTSPRTQSLTLHADLVDRLRTLARHEQRDINAVLNDALDRYMKSQ